jgi:ABC-2 type transport system permease protein
VVGLNYYMGSLTFGSNQPGVDLASVGLAPTLPGYLVIGVSVFVTLVSALALAIAISSFAEDVRSAQTIVGYFYFIIFVPMIFLMYTDINTLPLALRIIILAIPYTHPSLAARASFTGDYTTAVLGIVYVAIFTLVILYIAAKIFTTEKILTARIRFGRKAPRRAE